MCFSHKSFLGISARYSTLNEAALVLVDACKCGDAVNAIGEISARSIVKDTESTPEQQVSDIKTWWSLALTPTKAEKAKHLAHCCLEVSASALKVLMLAAVYFVGGR